MTKRNLGIDFLRFLAIVLVINSHMDAFYPIPQLGTGGALGNALFFMLSAFGLGQSQQRRPQDFWSYFKKRIIRIYPAVWVTFAILITPIAIYYHFSNPNLLTNLKAEFNLDEGILKGFSTLFFPPPAFWFLQALMMFYVFGYFYMYYFVMHAKQMLAVILLLTYTYLYINTQDFNYLVVEQHIEFKLIFYLLMFLFGIELAKRAHHVEAHTWKDWVGLALCIVILYGHKMLMMQGWAGEWQFVQQIAIFPAVFFALRVANCRTVTRLMQTTWVGPFMMLCAAMTLELYIVHGPIRGLINPSPTGFPSNALLYLPIVLLVAYAVHIVSRLITKRMLTEVVTHPT